MKHGKRMGEGCRYEMSPDGGDTVCCEYAYNHFGGYYACTAPMKCWMTVKVTVPFDSDKHCPNCSRPNKPVDMFQENNPKVMTCNRCTFTMTKWSDEK